MFVLNFLDKQKFFKGHIGLFSKAGWVVGWSLFLVLCAKFHLTINSIHTVIKKGINQQKDKMNDETDRQNKSSDKLTNKKIIREIVNKGKDRID